MEIRKELTVGQIVKENYKTAQIFDRNNIDFCCGGGISLEKACEQANVNIDSLLPELEATVQANDPDSRYIDAMELNELCDYIEKRHHSYVRETIPFLEAKLNKLCDVHGENHPELFKVRELFETAAGNLTAHMQKEELVLFPYIRRLVNFKNGTTSNTAEFGGIDAPIQAMLDEHQAEGERFFEIAELTSNYTCPSDGCNTYRITYQTLNDFEQDLHRHIHLENNILFLKALALEKEIISKK
ncbi:iron-sulfur cluster repair di-iron protein [Draconibacterium halophilum]|uniref:Iron-sulfur cluster repair di-iron protein n=1 Tax=Draconibacterium halophilum TaxID=2706887 RepID=A0A6C0RDH9_9BACT|nr:iron-sulfur cluster repair di-iron protein [Draconibacterium halophilum]QIA07553.1 iron-sulfur cluster repair di-iron protein [Draconibacterium halophilum]